MTNLGKPYTILVGIDFSDASDGALDEALTLAMERHGELHVLYVDDHFRAPEGGREAAENTLLRVEHHTVARMKELGRRLGRDVSCRKIYSHFRLGGAAEQIVQLASDLDADLMVVGTHGRSGLKRVVLGSEAERVMRMARCPTLIIRPKDHEGLGNVPEIAPPCKDCLAKRAETAGATFWCERHSEHHVRAHVLHSGGGLGGDHGASGTTATPV